MTDTTLTSNENSYREQLERDGWTAGYTMPPLNTPVLMQRTGSEQIPYWYWKPVPVNTIETCERQPDSVPPELCTNPFCTGGITDEGLCGICGYTAAAGQDAHR